MHNPALVGKRHIRPDKDIIRDGLAEYFDAQYIGNYLLRLALYIWMDECDMVVGADDVA